MTTLLYEIPTMKIIMETIRVMISPLGNILIILFSLFQILSMTGMILFGGEVTLNNPLIQNDSGVPSTYPYDNFNDMLTGMVTLFTLLIVNNWQVTVEMYVDVKNGNTYYRIFFIIVYFFCVVMLLNIVVAFSIDMYASVQRLNN